MAGAEAEAPRAAGAMRQALRDVELALPHLTGLVHAVRVVEDPRVGTLGVFRSGRLLVNPTWFLALDRQEARFAVAHELLHLVLRTHERAAGSEPELFNLAHDAIINDVLVEALGGLPAAGGFWLWDARHRAAEEVVAELRRDMTAHPGIYDAWRTILREPSRPPETALGAALRAAGLVPSLLSPVAPADAEHVLSDELEARWFPRDDPDQLATARDTLRVAGARAGRIESLTTRLEQAFGAARAESDDAEPDVVQVEALPTLHPPPWETALQRWLESAGPGPRSYARPSRRGADRPDIVLAGRRREERRLHVVLDTSASMSDEFGRVLGAIAAFCERADVAVVRVLQCDTGVTRDECLTPEAFRTLEVAGIGGSDLSPALERLAAEPAVEAAVVITDGSITYPENPMPYAVLWALTAANFGFEPAYGQLVEISRPSRRTRSSRGRRRPGPGPPPAQ